MAFSKGFRAGGARYFNGNKCKLYTLWVSYSFPLTCPSHGVLSSASLAPLPPPPFCSRCISSCVFPIIVTRLCFPQGLCECDESPCVYVSVCLSVIETRSGTGEHTRMVCAVCRLHVPPSPTATTPTTVKNKDTQCPTSYENSCSAKNNHTCLTPCARFMEQVKEAHDP